MPKSEFVVVDDRVIIVEHLRGDCEDAAASHAASPTKITKQE